MLRTVATLLFALLVMPSAQAVDVGQPAPDFSLANMADHSLVTRQSIRGKVVLVDFWASWCGPCRQSMPLYDKLRGEFPSERFDILAINLDEEYTDAQAFMEKNKVSYPVALDPGGGSAKAFGLIGMPSSFLLDADGIVRARHNGFRAKDIDELRTQIAALLGKPDAH